MAFPILLITLFSISFVSIQAREGSPLPSVLANSAPLRQVSPDVFSCNSSDPVTRAICNVGLQKVNDELSSTGVTISKDGILFEYNDPTDKKINTGRSCSITAAITNTYVSSLFSSSSTFNSSFISISEPMMVSARVPIKISARISAKQRFGARIFGKCKNYGSDSFVMKGDISTVANIAVGFYLNSTISVIPSGDYVLTLRPSAVMMLHIENTDLDFHVSGVSPLSAVWTSIVSSGTAIFSALDALFDGKSVLKDLGNSLALSTAVPIVLGVGALPKDLETSLWGLLLDKNVHEFEKRSSEFGNDFETTINNALRKGLKTDSTGTKQYIISKDVVHLLKLGKSVQELVRDFPTDHSIACFQEYGRSCGRGGCSGNITPCLKARHAYRETYRQSSFRHALPQIAS